MGYGENTMKFEIKHRWSGDILFSVEAKNLKLAIEAAIKAKANLSWADLSGANLIRANLSGANLSGANLIRANLSEADLIRANLSEANLSEADLIRANLSGANLSEANLSEADLIRANLSWADLSGANLSEADLIRANLSGANLSGANLSGANLIRADQRSLRHIKHDIWGVLLHARTEVPALRQAVLEGRIDGSVYEGECACLCGTIANARKCTVNEIPGVQPDSASLAERFFMAIKKGDTPENNPASKLVLEWIDEFIALTK
jgi:hypothetical protein